MRDLPPDRHPDAGALVRSRVTALIAFLAALLLAGLLVGCTDDGGSIERKPTPRPSGVDDPVTADTLGGWEAPQLEWSDCGDDVECATLVVPLDWDEIDGDTIDLALGRRLATGDRIGALLMNPGGPGGSGLDYLGVDPFDEALSERFDVVSWDPRGVGQSTSFDCDDPVDEFLANDPDPDDPAEQAAIDEDAEAVAEACEANSGDLIGNVGTDDVARDLEAIRLALGEEQLTYIGFSYGTLIGLRYLELFGEHARAIVLDGVVDPTLDFREWLTGQTVAIDASISRAFDACDERSDCPVDDLAAAYDRVKEMVETEPIPGGDRLMGPAELQTATVFVSYEPFYWEDLATGLADALDGDATAMLALADNYYDFGGFTSYAAVECLDSEHPTGSAEYEAFADELRELSPRIGGSVANELLPCAYWPTPPQPITGEVSGKDGPPVLVLGNRGDAATPYESSVKVADMLADGHLVSYDGEGHTSYGRSSCVDDAVHAYLIDLAVPEDDPDC